MIHVHKASKQYGDLHALHDVSFKVSEGEIIGLLGLNGAGKTTTMRLITGVTSPTSGIVQVNTLDPIVQHLEVSKLLGYLPENNPLYTDMTVSEYLILLHDIKHETSLDTIEKVVEQTGLAGYLYRKIDTLSRGYRQRVGLAASLVGNPSLLILDEPTSGLDPIEQEKIRKLIMHLGKHKTVLFSTHILSEVEEIATRIIILHKGRLVYDGDNPKKKGSVESLFKHYVS